MQKHILLVEDDVDVLELLGGTLRKAGGFSVLTATDGSKAISLARTRLPDAIVLDLMLPGMTGFEVCRTLKSYEDTRKIPIIMLTAKGDEVDRITGLELGADDYITKPFSPREVVLRLCIAIGRHHPSETSTPGRDSGPIVLDWPRHVVTVSGNPVRLTTTEFKLLAAFLERRGRVLGREALLNEVWGYNNSFTTRTVDTHVRRLREKLGDLAHRIETIRGFGYRMKEAE